MEDHRFLKVFDRLKWVFDRMHVNYPVMRQILAVKLLMDARRTPVVLGDRARNKKKGGNLFLKSLWVYALTGLFLVPIYFLGNDYLFKMSLVFSIILFMVMTAMIADFSAVLLDARDQSILWTKPIDSRTLHAAKTVHVCIYLVLLTGAISLPSAIVGLMRSGPLFLLLFLLNLVLIDLIAISCTTFIYLIVLKFFDGERLKDVINYVQIFLSFAIAIGYQLVIRAFDITVNHISLSLSWWQFFVPPLWFGAMTEWLIGGHHNASFLTLGVLGLVVPIVLILIYHRFSASFERAVMKLSVQTGKGKKRLAWFNRLLGKLLCRKQEEWHFFRFASLMIKQDRMFKLKVYPSLGMSLVFPFIFLMNNLRDASWDQLGNGSGYFYVYFSLLLIPTSLFMLKYSSSHRGAWIYGAAPITNQSAIFSATLKAVFAQLFLPVFLILSVLFLFLFHERILPDLIAVVLTASIFIVISHHYFLDGTLPFSEPFDAAPTSGNATILFLFLIAGLFAAGHAVIRWALPGYGIHIYIACLLIANGIVWKTGVRKE
ncbi:hypothetical protein NIE88_06685 [Sporolactobacillus shoreicorticis]|uniref:ABC transporter permease n=1 Tax=Sporolactobacillus shoreicorticis TaxID=1923877 RepID=A0ABW5S8I2_9BACL|nr:hypothetical protein [Sporolactobacillus shoreicorticis]MCO7125454.1 hypothetical protein [Sporolactobacillus shoreicorticis]